MKMKWEELFSGKCFVTDLGSKQLVEQGGETLTVGQYAVWAPMNTGNGHQIVEVSDNLAALTEKYHIPADCVCTLK